MIQINDLSFSYDNSRTFIENLNVLIPDGKVTSIIGPNGSGKSTLLNLISGVIKPNNGTVIIDGTDIFRTKRKEIAKKLSIVFQNNNAPEDVTVKELVSLGRNPHKKYFEQLNEHDLKIIDWAMAATKVIHLAEKPISKISGGERQRAWLAVGLAQSSTYLLLDEPTTYLDIRHQIEILNLVRKINHECNLTIVMVLHDINQAIKYSDTVIVMNKGKIIAYGSPTEVITSDLLLDVYGVKAEKIMQRDHPYYLFQEAV
ncbi:MAG: ABC transporter ATP-binding protein [Candidatus Aenigmatarchaeota archaeon]